MNVVICVLREKIDMRLGGVVGLDLHLRGRPGAVAAGGIAQGHGEFIEVRTRAADRFARRQRHGHLGFGTAGIHEALKTVSKPTLRVATPARSPVGEWQELHFPAPLKYCLP